MKIRAPTMFDGDATITKWIKDNTSPSGDVRPKTVGTAVAWELTTRRRRPATRSNTVSAGQHSSTGSAED